MKEDVILPRALNVGLWIQPICSALLCGNNLGKTIHRNACHWHTGFVLSLRLYLQFLPWSSCSIASCVPFPSISLYICKFTCVVVVKRRYSRMRRHTAYIQEKHIYIRCLTYQEKVIQLYKWPCSPGNLLGAKLHLINNEHHMQQNTNFRHLM